MAKFTFKLEAVLEQRLHAERHYQRELALTQHKLLRLQAEIDAMGAVSRSSATQLRSRKLSTPMLAAYQRFDLAMRQKGGDLKQQLLEARQEVESVQAALTEAARQRKVMEKLRERDQSKWAEEQRRKELADADDIARQVTGASSNPFVIS